MTDFEFINNTFVSMLKITNIGNEGNIILLIFNKLINFYRFEANSSREFRTFWYSKKKIGLMIIYQEVSA